MPYERLIYLLFDTAILTYTRPRVYNKHLNFIRFFFFYGMLPKNLTT